MSSKLIIALAVLVVLVGLTAVQFNAETTEDRQGTEVTVDLPSIKADDIDRLEVSAPEKKPVTLIKDPDSEDGAGWKLTVPVEAKAASTALNTAVDKLSELEVTAVAATRKENHERLEVTKEKGIHVVAKKGDTTLVDLWIGAYRSGNTMVRAEGEDRVAAVKGSIRFAFDKDVKEWRDRTITDVEQSEVLAITLTSEKGTLRFEKDGEGYKQAEGQAAIPDFDAEKVKSVIGTASHLRAVDFGAPDMTLASAGVDDAGKAHVLLELASDAGPSQVLLRVGTKVNGGNYHVAKDGDDVLYQVSSFMGDRLTQGPEGFKKDPPAPKNAAAPQGLPQGLPPGISPEQIKQMMPAGHP